MVGLDAEVEANASGIAALNDFLGGGNIRFKEVYVSSSEQETLSRELELNLSDFGVQNRAIIYIASVAGRMNGMLFGAISSSNSYHTQIIFSNNNLRQYRYKAAGSWYEWQTFVTSADA